MQTHNNVIININNYIERIKEIVIKLNLDTLWLMFV